MDQNRPSRAPVEHSIRWRKHFVNFRGYLGGILFARDVAQFGG